LEEYFAANPMKDGAVFNHFRPARLLTERAGALKARLSDDTLKRFEKAFKKLNSLL
jgi:hypothetical protein